MGNIKNTDIVYCFDDETGKEIWKHSYSQRLDPKYYEGGTLASPTVADGRVYTISKDGKAFCLDAETSRQIWSKDVLKDFGIKRTEWGCSGSPYVTKDIVIYNVGSGGLALNKADASLIWENGKGPGGYATAVPFTSASQDCIALFGFREVLGLVAATGKELWRHGWKTKYDVHAADPIIVSEDTIFISSGYANGCALLKIQMQGAQGSVTELWRNKNMRNKMNASVLWQGHIYGVDEKGELRCLSLKTGEPVWAEKGFGQGSLMIADGKLIVMGEKGNLVVAEASPEGYKVLSSADILTGKCWTVPVLANGRIYTRNAAGDMVCVDVRGKATACAGSGNDWPQFRGQNRNGKSSETGLLKKWPQGGPTLLWSVEGLGTGFSSMSVVDGLIYTTGLAEDKQGTILAFDIDGNLKWKKSYGPGWTGSHRGVRTTPTVDGDRVYVMSGHGNLVCYDAKTGELKWQVDTLRQFKGKNIKWGISESVLIDGKKVICTPGGEDATVVAIDKMTGETIWTSKGLSEASAYCCPVIFDMGANRVLITMVEKSIVALDPETGKVHWQIPHETSHDISAVIPVYHDGKLYVTNGYGKGGMMLELSDDGTSYTKKWTDKNLDCHHGGVILLEGNIHGSNHKGQDGNKKSWICLELATGKVKYHDKLVGKGCAIYVDGMLYCYGESGMVGLVKVTPAGYEMVSSFEITKGEEEHWAHPVISNGRLYIRHGDVLMAYHVKAP
jgi:outer membrane protein assembly factor BamB